MQGLHPLKVDLYWFNGCKSRVKLATKLDLLMHSDKKYTNDHNWFSKNAKEVDMVWEEGEDSDEEFDILKEEERRKIKALSTQLSQLLESPLTPKGMSKNFIAGGMDHSGLDINTKLAILEGRSIQSLESDFKQSVADHERKKDNFSNRKILGKRGRK